MYSTAVTLFDRFEDTLCYTAYDCGRGAEPPKLPKTTGFNIVVGQELYKILRKLKEIFCFGTKGYFDWRHLNLTMVN